MLALVQAVPYNCFNKCIQVLTLGRFLRQSTSI